MKKQYIFTFIFVVTGAIVGAGFASGKEIATFFAQFGFWSILAVVLSGLLFFCVFFLFSKIGNKIKPKSISDITKNIFGKAGMIVDFAFILTSFITLSSMLAGLDSSMQIMLKDAYIFPFLSIVACFVVVLLLEFGVTKIFKASNYILPVMFATIFVVTICFLVFGSREQVGYNLVNHNVLSMSISPILYVSMNTFGNIFLISKVSEYMDKKHIVIASIFSSLLLFLSIILVLLCILFGGEKVFLSDMPMLEISSSLGSVFKILYFATLITAIFTTIYASAYTIHSWLKQFISNSFLSAVIVLSFGFVFSRFGFATIVDIFYPIEGVFGTIFIIFTFVYHLKSKKKLLKTENKKILNSIEITKLDGKTSIKKKYKKRSIKTD